MNKKQNSKKRTSSRKRKRICFSTKDSYSFERRTLAKRKERKKSGEQKSLVSAVWNGAKKREDDDGLFQRQRREHVDKKTVTKLRKRPSFV